MKNNLDVKYLFLIALVALLTISIWFRHGYQLGTAEGGLPFNNLQRHANVFKYSWADTGLGNSTGYLVAAYPTYFVLSKIELLNIPPFLIEAFIFWIILICAGFGIFGLGRKIVGLSPSFALVAVLFYWLCPFVLVNVWSRFLYNHIFFLGLLPLGLYFFMAGLQTRKYLYALFTVIVLLFFSYSLTALALTFLFFSVLGIVLVFYCLTERTISALFFAFKYALLFGLLFSLSNYWWLSQMFSIGNSTSFNQSALSFFTTEGNVMGLTGISNKLGSLIDLSRFIHYSYFYNNSSIWAAIFIKKTSFIIHSLILLFTLLGIYWSRKNKRMLLFSLLFIGSFFMAKGNMPPFGEIYTYFFVKLPFLQIFRNPIEKISIISVLSGAMLFAYSLEHIYQKYLLVLTQKFNGRNYLALGTILFLSLFWGWPFFSGLVFTSFKGPSDEILSYETEVPEYYQTANKYIQNNSDISRFLALPIMGEGISYNWKVPYSGIDLYSTLFSKQNIALNTTIPFYNNIVEKLSYYQFSEQIMNFIPFLAIDQIVVRNDVDTISRNFPDSDNTTVLLNKIEVEKLINKTRIIGELSLYDISDQLKWGKIYLTNQINLTNETDFTKLFGNQDFQKKVYVSPSHHMNLSFSYNSIQIVPEKVIKYDIMKKYKNYSKDELIAELLFVKHSPDTLLYPFVRSKELLTSLMYADYPKWVLFNTELLGKRMVEICQFNETSSDNLFKRQLLDRYIEEYQNLKPFITQIVKENRSLKTEIINSLAAQSVLSTKCSQLPFFFYKELFTDLKILQPSSDNELKYESITELNYYVPVSGMYKRIDSVKSTNISTLNSVAIANEYLPHGEKLISFKDDDAFYKEVVYSAGDFTIDQDWRVEPNLLDDYEAEYEISIDYQTIQGDFLGLYVKQDIDNHYSPRLFQGIELSREVRNFKILVTPTLGAKNISIGLTGNKNLFCTPNCNIANNQLIANIKKFVITKRKQKEPVFLMNTPKASIQTTVNWEKISPVEYHVRFNKKSSDQEVLVFSELFSDGWKIKSSQIDNHILVNGYANGWVIDKPGDYDVSIFYQPEDNLKKGYWISAISILILIILLFVFYKYGKN